MDTTHRDNRSVPELIQELKDELLLLAKQEVNLAKVETISQMRALTRHVLSVVIGGLLLYAGLYFLLFALAAGVGVSLGAHEGVVMAYWLAPLIVGVVVCAVGYFGISKGAKKLKGDSIVPERTIQSIQESSRWIARQVRT